jgi:tRNA(Ile)-lysidine synthase TilS/MesJ
VDRSPEKGLHAAREKPNTQSSPFFLPASVGLSGGKDSLSLLHTLLLLQKQSRIDFEIGGATVDPQTPEFDPR